MNLTILQTSITSATKAVNKARVNGKLDLLKIALYDLFAYYADYTFGKPEYNKEYLFLINKLVELRYENPDIICNYKNSLSSSSLRDTIGNYPPTVSGTTIDIDYNDSYYFSVGDFTTDYADTENNPWDKVTVYTDGLAGSLKYNGTTVTGSITISVESVTSLVYTRENNEAFTESLGFRISDKTSDSKFSIITYNTISGGIGIGENEPPVVGDNTVYVDNRVETILTLDMFTTELQPPYNDPEGDLIDAIRIDEISTANQGKFYVDGIEISVDDIITRETLEANLFVHIGADEDTISSDVINFSARDEGSQIWVQ